MLKNRRIVRVEWGDCDPAGIVYYPRYFAFFDQCTAAMFEAVGLPKPRLLEQYDIVGFPVVETSATFHRPSTFGDDIAIETTIAEFGRSSFKVQHRVLKDEVLAIEAGETRVWVGRDPQDPRRLKSKPIPTELIDRFR